MITIVMGLRCTGWVKKNDPLKMCLFTPYMNLTNGLNIPTSMSTSDSYHENSKLLKILEIYKWKIWVLGIFEVSDFYMY